MLFGPLLLVISVQTQAPAVSNYLANIPNTTVDYYEVEGRNVTEDQPIHCKAASKRAEWEAPSCFDGMEYRRRF